jgi:hypothetical protein
MRHMRVVEEEVSLSQPETIEVPPEEEEVPVLQGPAVTIPLGEEVPPEEEEVIAPPGHGPAIGPHYHGPTGGRSPVGPPYRGSTRRKGMPCLDR